MIPTGRLDPPAAWRSPATRQLLSALGAAGIGARLVGGCVRDALAGRDGADIDLAIDRPPEEAMAVLKKAGIKVVPTGLRHGTIMAVIDRTPFEITTLRRDVETDGRHATVAFTDDWLADAGRRDFTFNALYADPDGAIYDPFGGRADLAAGRVRFIGEADRRIEEDRLRVLRFFRFHAWFGRGAPDVEGLSACRRHAATLGALSAERVVKELLRLLAAADPVPAVEAMRDAGVLVHWLPELGATNRLAALLSREDAVDGLRRLAALLRDRGVDAPTLGKRLKLSTQEALRLEILVAAEPATDLAGGPRAWREGIYRLGAGFYADRLLLAVEAPGDWRAALTLARSWTPPEFPVRGADALKLGLKPGPRVGELVDAVERWWIAGDFTADRAACLADLERRMRAP